MTQWGQSLGCELWNNNLLEGRTTERKTWVIIDLGAWLLCVVQKMLLYSSFTYLFAHHHYLHQHNIHVQRSDQYKKGFQILSSRLYNNPRTKYYYKWGNRSSKRRSEVSRAIPLRKWQSQDWNFGESDSKVLCSIAWYIWVFCFFF